MHSSSEAEASGKSQAEEASVTQGEIEVGDDPELTRCDYSICAPPCCQKFRQRWLVLVFMCWCSFTQSMLVNGFVNSVVTSIEKRFGLTSKESGAIASFYDVGVVLVLVPVSFYGAKTRRLRFLSYGMAIMGVGSFIFALPHFTAGPYQYQSPMEPICYTGQNVTSKYTTMCNNLKSLTNLGNYKWVFWFSHMLIGIGASPLYTIGIAYLDDNLSTKSSAVYLGIFYCFSMLGPALGYLAGASSLDIFVDIGLPHPGLTILNKEVWVGAWWLGFVASAIIALCAVIPLFGFPREMPGTAEMRAAKRSEAFGESESSGLKVSITSKDFIKNVYIVCSNPTFIFVSLSAFAESIITSGVSTFGPKYIETVFGFDSGGASRLFGFTLVPMGGGGMIAGGLMIRFLTLDLIQILRIQAFLGLIPLPLIFAFLIPCGEEGGPLGWAGITTHYNNVSSGLYNLSQTCNAGCQCQPIGALFSPVCGSDKRSYFSPCYAGCSNGSVVNGYGDCSCFDKKVNSTVPETAIGACSKSCPNLVYFIIPFAVTIFFTFIISTPGVSSTIRCVPEKQKSLALGIQWMIIRVIGTIPGPIIMGAAFDTACVFWSRSCGKEGRCHIYSELRLRQLILILVLSAKIFSVLSLFLAWLLYEPSKGPSRGVTPAAELEGEDNNAMDRTDL